MGWKRPESVLVVVHTADGQALLLRRTRPDDFWQSVTGALRDGETPLQAARRELREETGIEAGDDLVETGIVRRFPILPAWRSRYAPGVTENREHRFLLGLPAPVSVHISPREHLEYRWLPLAEAVRLASSWTDREALEALRDAAGEGRP